MLSPSDDKKNSNELAARSSSIFFKATRGALSCDEWLKKTMGFCIKSVAQVECQSHKHLYIIGLWHIEKTYTVRDGVFQFGD